MKKLIISLAMTASLMFMDLKNANAQIILDTVTIKGNSTKAVVSEKVANSFNHFFKDATQPQWLEINKRFVVNFILDDQKNKAVFTKGGSLIYQLSYDAAKNLPDQIKKQIQETYQDFDITTAVKVKTGDDVIWLVNLESTKRILIVRATDEDMSVIDTIQKP